MTVGAKLELAALTVASALTAMLCCAFLMISWGPVPFPITAVVAGAANLGFLWLAGQYTSSGWRFAPIAAWAVVVIVAMIPGIGGNGAWIDGLPLILLFLLGLGAPSTIAARFTAG
ncbi:hypothetical protein MYK68_15180 [Gordonia sp. PP30]|uniref:hypothetical protein n=2 Tax=Gordonia TaxID=2053 RepID=UPI001FFE7586|nr:MULTISPECIES: hypothetical protein [unclassified Gordonia (in: high G+C Gram-positive bacteria)]UQE74068.1 hypothetical protein MYK68_15180 [Gordonia sp. PP30]